MAVLETLAPRGRVHVLNHTCGVWFEDCHSPAGLLVVPSSHTGDLTSAFEELYAQAPIPPLMRAGGMESDILRLHLVLHDAYTGTTEQLER